MNNGRKLITSTTFFIVIISLFPILTSNVPTIITMTIIATLAFTGHTYLVIVNPLEEKSFSYRSMLDSIPQPLSVTDMDMNWTFVNKAATDPLGVTLEDIIGQQCSNWSAPICKTKNCGVECLRNGKSNTCFDQWGKNFRVDTSYLHNRAGRKVGHIEVVNEITDKVLLENLLKKVNQFVIQIDSGASQVSIASQSLSSGATNQAASLEQITSSIAQISDQAKTNASNSGQVSELSISAATSTDNGLNKMAETVEAMSQITESSEEIKKIIKTIDDIAFQTNLLALNAAVEAARAGVHGKGFAVVAEEVRSLAGRSAKAARETAGLIEGAVNKINIGNTFANETAEALANISSSVTKVKDVVSKITTASKDQAQSISEINQGLRQIDHVTQQNTAVAEESSSAASELSQHASELSLLMNSFGQNEDEDEEISEHHKKLGE